MGWRREPGRRAGVTAMTFEVAQMRWTTRWRWPATQSLVLGLAVAACGTTPVPSSTAAVVPVASSSTASEPIPPLDPTLPPVTAPSPAPAPTRTPMPLKGFDIVLPAPPDAGVELGVRDWSGSLAGIAAADSSLLDLPDAGPRRLAIGPGTSERRITVTWVGGICDRWLNLDIAADGHTLTLHEPPGPGCDAMGIGRSVELRFEGTVDPAAFTGTQAVDAIAATDINPTVVAFADPLHGWVSGTMERGEAVILETHDGGVTWVVASLGVGTVSDIAATGDGAVAGRLCPEATPDCGPGLFRLDGDGDWSAEADDRPLAMDYAGDRGIATFLVPGRTSLSGLPIPDVRVTTDGFNWTGIANPCGLMDLVDVAIGPDAMPLALCTGQGGGGGQRKSIHRAGTAGEPWQVLSTTEAGGLPMNGTGVGFDFGGTVTGWMWGYRTPLLATEDGGRTWHEVTGPADGDVAITVGASALGNGAGYQLVIDPDRDATILSWTSGGGTWKERFAWPIHAVCCG